MQQQLAKASKNQRSRLCKTGFKTLKTLPAEGLGRAAASPAAQLQGEHSDAAGLAPGRDGACSPSKTAE